jgi:hypothetical protein
MEPQEKKVQRDRVILDSLVAAEVEEVAAVVFTKKVDLMVVIGEKTEIPVLLVHLAVVAALEDREEIVGM